MSDGKSVEKTVEERATEMGWVPQDQWKGNPDNWRPADEFVERGETLIPILKDRVNKLESDLSIFKKATEAELRAAQEAGKKLAEAEYNDKLRALKAAQAEAVKVGDAVKVGEISDQIVTLSTNKPEVTAAQSGQSVTPDFKEWHSRNPWYAPDLSNAGTADSDLTLFANAAGAELASQNLNLPEKEFLERIEKKVKSVFAHKFSNPERDKAAAVSSGENASVSSGSKKTWADLPQDAKNAYNRTVKRLAAKGMKYEKQTYVDDYFKG